MRIWLEGKAITHVCFIALTLAGSLWRCLSTQPIELVFIHLSRDEASKSENATSYGVCCMKKINHVFTPNRKEKFGYVNLHVDTVMK